MYSGTWQDWNSGKCELYLGKKKTKRRRGETLHWPVRLHRNQVYLNVSPGNRCAVLAQDFWVLRSLPAPIYNVYRGHCSTFPENLSSEYLPVYQAGEMRMLHYLPADVESKGENGDEDQEKWRTVSTQENRPPLLIHYSQQLQVSQVLALGTIPLIWLSDQNCNQNYSNI